MKNLVAFLFILSLLSCAKDDDKICCIVVSATASYSIFNSEGEDLLNPTIPNYFPFEEIEVYYLVNGVKTSPEDFKNNRSIDGKNLDTLKNPYRLIIYPYLPDPDLYEGRIQEDGTETGTAITYVQLSEEDTDTIKTKWSQSSNSRIITKLWYNGILQEERGRKFTIVK